MPAAAYPYTASPFGTKVMPTPMPQPFSDLAKLYPNLSGSNAAASSAILSRLKGELSPETLNNIQNAAATFGVTSGMPGSGLAQNRSLRDVGLTTEGLQEQGLRDYEGFLPVLSSTQTVNPALQTEINSQNAMNAAAPDPTAAATYAEQLYNKYLKKVNPSGGTSSTMFTATGPSGLPLGPKMDWSSDMFNFGV